MPNLKIEQENDTVLFALWLDVSVIGIAFYSLVFRLP